MASRFWYVVVLLALGACHQPRAAAEDVKNVTAQASIKLQRQLNSDFGVDRVTARGVELIQTEDRKFEGSATVIVDGTNVVLPLTAMSDGASTIITSDDGRIGEVIRKHDSDIAYATGATSQSRIAVPAVPVSLTPQQPVTRSEPVAARPPAPVAPRPEPNLADGDSGFCGRPTVKKQVPSLDGGYVYQQVCKWVTSDNIVQVRLADGRRKDVGPGNSLAVIRNGPYRGYLLLTRHKYRLGGGSYDASYVVRPDGFEALKVPGSDDGDDASVRDWLRAKGWTAS